MSTQLIEPNYLLYSGLIITVFFFLFVNISVKNVPGPAIRVENGEDIEVAPSSSGSQLTSTDGVSLASCLLYMKCLRYVYHFSRV